VTLVTKSLKNAYKNPKGNEQKEAKERVNAEARKRLQRKEAWALLQLPDKANHKSPHVHSIAIASSSLLASEISELARYQSDAEARLEEFLVHSVRLLHPHTHSPLTPSRSADNQPPEGSHPNL
jgi:hypothetical protein